MSEDSKPNPGDIRFTESGDVEVFDDGQWKPVRRLPTEGPLVFRDQPTDHTPQADS